MKSKKENSIPAWVHAFVIADADDPSSFVPPLFCMSVSRLSGKVTASSPSSSSPSSSKAAAYYKLNPTMPLLTALKNLHFIEFPTIDVFEESQFSGTIVDPEGAITQEGNTGEERPAKRPKLTAQAMQKAIGGHLGDYGSDSEEEQETRKDDRMATLGDYGDSDEGEERSAEGEKSPEGNVQFSDEEDEVDPQTLVQLLQQVQGQAMLDHDGLRDDDNDDDDDDQEVDWGDEDAERGE
jgi:hypothetical protein